MGLLICCKWERRKLRYGCNETKEIQMYKKTETSRGTFAKAVYDKPSWSSHDESRIWNYVQQTYKTPVRLESDLKRQKCCDRQYIN